MSGKTVNQKPRLSKSKFLVLSFLLMGSALYSGCGRLWGAVNYAPPLLALDTSAMADQTTHWNSSDNFFDGNWHHVAFTIDSSTVTLYKDGLFETSGTYLAGGGFCNSTASLLFGLNTQGSLDEVGIWKTVLTAQEIAAIYLRQVQGY